MYIGLKNQKYTFSSMPGTPNLTKKKKKQFWSGCYIFLFSLSYIQSAKCATIYIAEQIISIQGFFSHKFNIDTGHVTEFKFAFSRKVLFIFIILILNGFHSIGSMPPISAYAEHQRQEKKFGYKKYIRCNGLSKGFHFLS